jgi:hypothetical protein
MEVGVVPKRPDYGKEIILVGVTHTGSSNFIIGQAVLIDALNSISDVRDAGQLH